MAKNVAYNKHGALYTSCSLSEYESPVMEASFMRLVMVLDLFVFSSA